MFAWIFEECREVQIPCQLAAGYLIQAEGTDRKGVRKRDAFSL